MKCWTITTEGPIQGLEVRDEEPYPRLFVGLGEKGRGRRLTRIDIDGAPIEDGRVMDASVWSVHGRPRSRWGVLWTNYMAGL